MAVLMTYRWSGNVRELENVVQRMMVVAKGKVLGVEDLPPQFRSGEAAVAGGGLKGIARKSAGIVEKKAIEDALAATGGNVSRAAKTLGISRATLQNKMKAYGLRQPKPGAPAARDDGA
jgi:DNA-binding NtrC family response regulator